MSTPNKCLCGAAIEEIPAWNCLDCSKYEKTIICEDCYLRSKDLHNGHKIVYLSYAEGVCNCGDPESFNTYCHEHNGPFVELKQIDVEKQKAESLGKWNPTVIGGNSILMFYYFYFMMFLSQRNIISIYFEKIEIKKSETLNFYKYFRCLKTH